MAENFLTRERAEEMVATGEAQYSKDLIEDLTWTLDCGQYMGEPRTWVDLAPGLQALVHPANTNHVLLFYPRVKHWLDPKWMPTVYGPWWVD